MAAKKIGRPRVAKPKEGTARILTRFPLDLLARVEKAAAADDRSRDAWILRACREKLEREGA